MAGPVRHPIDVASLERYLGEHVPEIELPLDVKQVGTPPPISPINHECTWCSFCTHTNTLD